MSIISIFSISTRSSTEKKSETWITFHQNVLLRDIAKSDDLVPIQYKEHNESLDLWI